MQFDPRKHLSYGSVVSIRLQDQSKDKLYLASQGFIVLNIFPYKQSNPFLNFSSALFRICAALPYKSQKKIRQHIEQRKQEMDINILSEFEFQINENMESAKRSLGQPLKYKQSFYLQHLYSQKFLSLINKSESQLSLELCQIPGENSIFKVQTCYDYQKRISSYIKFNEPIYLSKSIDSRDAFVFYQKQPLTLQLKSKYFGDFMVSFGKKSQLVFVAFDVPNKQIAQSQLKYGDNIWFYHIQSSSFLVSQQGQNRNNFLLDIINTAQNRLPQRLDTSLPQILIEKAADQNDRNILGLWQVEGLDKQQGGLIMPGSQIRFYHTRNHYYLCVSRDQEGKLNLCTSKQINPTVYFQTELVSGQESPVSTNELYLIKNIQYKVYLTVPMQKQSREKQKKVVLSKNYLKQDNFKFYKAEKKQIWFTNSVLSAVPFVNLGLQVLRHIVTSSAKSISLQEQTYLLLLRQGLIHILNFSKDIRSIVTKHKKNISKPQNEQTNNQRRLKQVGFLEILPKILLLAQYFVFLKDQGYNQTKLQPKTVKSILERGEILASDKRKQLQDLRNLVLQIVRLALGIIGNMCLDNRENKNVFYRFTKYLIKYFGMNLLAEQAVFQILKNNQAALLQIGAEDEGQSLISIAFQQFTTKARNKPYFTEMLDFCLNAMTLGETSVSSNQSLIFQLLIQNKLADKLLIPFTVKDCDIFIKTNAQQRPLRQYIKGLNQERQTAIQFFAKQLKVFGSMCKNRNYTCISYFRKIFTAEALITLMKDQRLDERIRASLCFILNHAIIDTHPRVRRQLPDYLHKLDFQNEAIEKQRLNYRLLKSNNQKTSVEHVAVLRQLLLSDEKTIGLYYNQNLRLDFFKDLAQYVKNNICKGLQEDRLFTPLNKETIAAFLMITQFQIIQFKEEVYELLAKVLKSKQNSVQVQINKEISEKIRLRQILNRLLTNYVLRRKKTDFQEEQLDPNLFFTSNIIKDSFFRALSFASNTQSDFEQVITTSIKLLKQVNAKTRQFFLNTIMKNVNEFIKINRIADQHQIKQFNKETLLPILKRLDQETKVKTESLLQSTIQLFYESESPHIQSQSLSLVIDSLNQKKMIIKQLKKIVVITDLLQIQYFRVLESKLDRLNYYVDSSQVWLEKLQDAKNNQSIVADKFIALINQIIGYMYESNSYSQYLPASKIDFQRQNLMRIKNVHKTMVKMIKDNFQIIDRVRQKNKKFLGVTISLFQKCVQFLTVFCSRYNFQNKHQLNDELSFFTSLYIQNKYKIGLQKFFAQLLLNNTAALQKLQPDFIRTVFQRVYKNNSYQSLKVINSIIFYRGKLLARNSKLTQNEIFQDKVFLGSLFLKQGASGYEFNLNRQLVLSGLRPHFYHIKILQFYNQLIKNLPQSEFLKNKFKQYLSLTHLVDVMRLPDIFASSYSGQTLHRLHFKLKHQVLILIHTLYLNEIEEKDLSEIFLQIVILLSEQLTQFQLKVRRPQDLLKQNLNTIVLGTVAKEQQFRMIDISQKYKQKEIEVEYYNLEESQLIFYTPYFLSVLEVVVGLYWLQERAPYQVRPEIKKLSLAYLHNYTKLVFKFKQSQLFSAQFLEKFQQPQKVPETIQMWIKQEQRRISQAQFFNKQTYQIFQFPIQNLLYYKQNIYFQTKRHIIWRSMLLDLLTSPQIETMITQDRKAKMKIFIKPEELKTSQNQCMRLSLLIGKVISLLQQLNQEYVKDQVQKQSSLANNILRILQLFNDLLDSQRGKQILVIFTRNDAIKSMIEMVSSNSFRVQKSDCMRIISRVLIFFIKLLEDGQARVQQMFYRQLKTRSGQKFLSKIKKYLQNHPEQNGKQYFPEQKLMKHINQINYSFVINQKENSSIYIFKFFQSLAEGQFVKNQILLTNSNDFNAIQFTISAITATLKASYPINSLNFQLVQQYFLTITELLQGPCTHNQKIVISSKFLQISCKMLTHEPNYSFESQKLNDIQNKFLSEVQTISESFVEKLRQNIFRGEVVERGMISRLQYVILQSINALLEGNSSKQCIQLVQKVITQNYLKFKIVEIYEEFLKIDRYSTQLFKIISADADQDYKQPFILLIGFKAFFLIKTYQLVSGVQHQHQVPKEYTDLKTKFSNEMMRRQNNAYDFFQSKALYIQILRDGMLYPTYFPKLPICDYLIDQSRNEFNQTVSRITSNSKLSDFTKRADELVEDMKIQMKKAEFAYLIGLGSLGPKVFTLQKGLERILMVIVVVTNVLLLVSFTNNQINNLYSLNVPTFDFQTLWTMALAYVLVLISMIICFNLMVFNGLQVPRVLGTLVKTRQVRWKQFIKSFYYVIYFFLLILGLFNPWPIVILLYDFFVNINEARQMVKSIYNSFSKLMVVVGLLIIVNYIFTIILYFSDQGPIFAPVCQDFFRCFGMVYDSTFKYGGGFVSNRPNSQDPLTTAYYSSLIIFDFLYIFLISVIIQQLIGAVIVDTFLQIRSKEEGIQVQKKERCFICGIQTQDLDYHQNGFQVHITKYHNMWNYLFYLVYLSFKSPQLYSGIQSFVVNCKEKGSIEWFPLGRSFTLEKSKESQENQQQEQKNQFQSVEAELQALRKTVQKAKVILRLRAQPDVKVKQKGNR